MRIIVRGWGDGALIFKDSLELDNDEDEMDAMEKAREHVDLVTKYERHMLEIEFLDEPDPEQRFFRWGTDASGMVLPVRIT